MPKHMTIINLACTITKLRKWGQAWKYSAESAQNAASQLTAEHERKLTEHRAAFGARTKADAETIDRLHTERDALRAEVADLKTQLERLTSWAAKNQAARETLQTEIERLKSQTPKHPAKVGEWVRRTTGSDSGRMAQVKSIAVLQYDVQIDGYKAFWASSNCEPCDPPASHDTPAGKEAAHAAAEPKPGDTVRLVRIPSRSDVSPKLQTNLEWPWLERWGTLNQTAMVVKPAHQLAGAVPVCLSTNVRARWPICCVEVVRTEPDAIKVGDVVEVFRDSSGNTLKTDVGITGKVLKLYKDFIDGERLVMLDPESQNRQSEGGCHYALCDVRKVTT